MSVEGVVELPDGTRLRWQSLRSGKVLEPAPQWGLYLLGKPAPPNAMAAAVDQLA